MQATPAIDWAALAHAEANDPAPPRLHATGRRKRWLLALLVVLVVGGPIGYVLYLRHQHAARAEAQQRYYEQHRLR